MIQIDFSHNQTGKLFLDFFGDIRQHNPEKHYVGSVMQGMHKSLFLGTIKIVAVRIFPYSRISDACAYLNVGKAAAYQAKLLDNFYAGGNTLKPDFKLDHIIFTYTDRNIEAQEQLMQEWWEAKKR